MTPTIICAIEETTADSVVSAGGELAETFGQFRSSSLTSAAILRSLTPAPTASGRATAAPAEAKRSCDEPDSR